MYIHYDNNTLYLVIYEDIDMNKEIVLFFHGFGSSSNTNKFTCIEMNKECNNVDYVNTDIDKIFNDYDKHVQSLIEKYDTVILVGHSLGGYFANHFANKYKLKALLINPCVRPSHYIKDRINGIENLNLQFNTNGAKEVVILAEKDDEVLDLVNDLKIVENNENYSVQFFNGGHHRTCREDNINLEIDELFNHPLVF